MLSSLMSTELGAGFAVRLFTKVGALGAASLRLCIAAVLLATLVRPRVRGRSRSEWVLAAAYGSALAAMNMLFYQSLARIPLAAAATLEVLGPLTLSVIISRRLRNWIWAIVSLAGVVILGHSGLHRLDPVGVGFALGAAVMWATFIVLASKASERFEGVDGLSIALCIGAVLSLPFCIGGAGTAVLRPEALAIGCGVALLSSTLPYSLQVFALRRLVPSSFSIMMSLAPALAALAGFLVLGQALTPGEGLAIGLVIIASAGSVRTSARLAEPLTAPQTGLQGQPSSA